MFVVNIIIPQIIIENRALSKATGILIRKPIEFKMGLIFIEFALFSSMSSVSRF